MIELVLEHVAGVREQRIDDGPGCFDHVLPGEERGVSGHRVAEQPFVVAERPSAWCSTTDSSTPAARHAFARPLRARADRDRDLRSQAKSHIVADRGAVSLKTTCGGSLNSTNTSVAVILRLLPART